jgi:hypothetical protein
LLDSAPGSYRRSIGFATATATARSRLLFLISAARCDIGWMLSLMSDVVAFFGIAAVFAIIAVVNYR